MHARRPVDTNSYYINTFADQNDENIFKNKDDDTNTLTKSKDTFGTFYHEPNHEDTQDIVYYSDYYEDGICLLSLTLKFMFGNFHFTFFSLPLRCTFC